MALLVPLAVLSAVPLAAQAIVGYGALTGASSVGASGGKAAGQAAGRTMRRVGGSLAEASGPASAPAGRRPSAEGVLRLGFDAKEGGEASIVVFAEWAGDDGPAEPVHSAAAAATASPAAPKAAAPGAATSPNSLKRGAKIEDVIAELGRPALVINGSGTAGYDRKYVFRSAAGTGHAVLVLGDRVVDWSSE